MRTLGIDQGNMHRYSVLDHGVGSELLATGLMPILSNTPNLMVKWEIDYVVLDCDPCAADARRLADEFPGKVSLCRYRRTVAGQDIVMDSQGTACVNRSEWLRDTFRSVLSGNLLLPRLNEECRRQLLHHRVTLGWDENGNLQETYTTADTDDFVHSLVYARIAEQFASVCCTGP